VDYIKDVANWLSILRDANYKVGLYDRHIFNQVLADVQLFVFCTCLEQRDLEIQKHKKM
jgi:hypothetical protein